MKKLKTKRKRFPKAATKAVKVKCPDCGRTYVAGAAHNMFCAAKTCNECGSTFGHVLPVYDSRTKPVTRLCDECLSNRMDNEDEDELCDEIEKEREGE